MLAFVRVYDGDQAGEPAGNTILCVNNLSKFPQPVELDRSKYIGWAPVECMGASRSPRLAS